ncbi:hypothetical protein [Saccharopolyspora sp. NPDC002376]
MIEPPPSMPVYLRVGNTEAEIGRVRADPLAIREVLATFLRAVADEIEGSADDAPAE